MLLLLVLLGFLFFAAVAMCINEGLWNNTILLFCILISGLTASIVGVPLGAMILDKTGQADDNAWYYIFVGLWGVFSLTLLVLRIAVDKSSGIRVRFLPLVDKIVGPLMGLFVAVMLTSFAAFTLMNGPVKAGVGQWNEASASRISAFEKVVGPFFTVAKNFSRAEKTDSSFFGK